MTKGVMTFAAGVPAMPYEEVGEYGIESCAFALDRMAVIVHPDNPVTGLSARRVRDIFAGAITN
jgi:phosphate transport system substrate-binding protein